MVDNIEKALTTANVPTEQNINELQKNVTDAITGYDVTVS